MSESHKLKIALSNTGKNTTQETLDKIKKTKLEKGRDILRTRELQENGYLVLRYWEGEFNLEVVEKDIDRIVEGKHKLLFI